MLCLSRSAPLPLPATHSLQSQWVAGRGSGAERVPRKRMREAPQLASTLLTASCSRRVVASRRLASSRMTSTEISGNWLTS